MCLSCAGGGGAAGAKAMMDKVMGDIEKFGWSVVAVGDQRGAFFYTVGLTLLRMPELYVAHNQDIDGSHRLLNDLGTRQKQAGAFTPGQITQREGRQYRTDKMWSLKDLGFVRKMFGDNKPTRPTALEVVAI